MADDSLDPKEEREVARLYRELPREEPSAHLDAAILQAARREGSTHAAPLVPPTGRRSWAFPLAAAAVVVLAVALTSQVEREQPDPVLPAPQVREEKPAQEEMIARDAQARPRAENRVQAPAVARRKVQPAAPEVKNEPLRADVQPLAKQTEQAPAGEAASAPAPRAARAMAFEPPERWLERIAELRKAGKDEDADRQLAEFRKRYPDFRIAPDVLEKVEKR